MYAKAAEVLNARDGGEAGRVRKMMATRPGLNANQRRAPKQDLSGAANGTITGRGGNVQQLGKAAMGRMPQASPMASTMGDGPPPGSVTPEMIDRMRTASAANPVPQIGGRMAGFPSPSDMDLQAAQAGGAPPQSGELMRQPKMLQGQQLADAMQRRGMPMGGGGVGGAPGMPPGAGPMGMETAEMGGQGAQPFGQGLPPQIMQRLQALKGGGMQGPAPAGGAMAGPQQRSFQDFWQGGGMAPRGM
jgi:hypothetical protein